MGSQRRLHGFPKKTSHFRLPLVGEDTSMDIAEENKMEGQEDVDMGVLEEALVPWAPPIEPIAWLASQCEQSFGKEEVMES